MFYQRCVHARAVFNFFVSERSEQENLSVARVTRNFGDSGREREFGSEQNLVAETVKGQLQRAEASENPQRLESGERS
jgi:hypothetical protein